MAATIKIKNSSTAGAVPTSSDLVQGELAVNVTDRRIYTENASGTIVELGTPSIDDNGNATAITIDSSENVGIGTSSPASQLDVSKTGDAILSLTSAGVQRYQLIARSGGRFDFYDQSAGATRWSTDQSGNLLVGTTTADGKITAYAATADGTSSAITAKTSGGSILMRVRADGLYNLGLQTNSPYNFTSTGANAILFSDGTLGRATSSLKYKRNVENTTHGLQDVLNLRAVTYKSKNERDGETVFGGLIAEEVHAAGLTEFVQYAEDGTPDSIYYANMVSLAFKAIQEQQVIINAQQTALTQLQADVAALKGQA